MFLVYMSLTGNVENFVERVGYDSFKITESNPYIEMKEDYIIVIPTYVGYVNYDVESFIEYKDNLKHLVGFASSGNLNFNDLYCINAIELSEQYNKPLIMKFEYMGTDEDVEKFKKEVLKIEIARTKQKH